MIRIFERDTVDLDNYDILNNGLGLLPYAADVHITERINDSAKLEFRYPANALGAALIEVGRIAFCERQGYRIESVVKKGAEYEVMCNALFWSDCAKAHIPSMGEPVGGIALHEVMRRAFNKGLTDKEVGLQREIPFHYTSSPSAVADGDLLDEDFLIDFWECDKKSLVEVTKTAIEEGGRGEIYIDNFEVSVVKRLGADRGAVLSLDRNCSGIDVTRDFSEVVTRLWAYGENDMTFGSVNGGVSYIDSKNIAEYGIREGYLDLADYTDAQALYDRAKWEFDADNENRQDVPRLTVTVEWADTSAVFFGVVKDIQLGDTVTVRDNAPGGGVTEYKLRAVEVERYPYESGKGRVVIGEVERDLYFYLKEFKEYGYRFARDEADVKRIWNTINSKKLIENG